MVLSCYFSIEKLNMKISSAQHISQHYRQIMDKLKQEKQNYPWKLNELGMTSEELLPQQSLRWHRHADGTAIFVYREGSGAPSEGAGRCETNR